MRADTDPGHTDEISAVRPVPHRTEPLNSHPYPTRAMPAQGFDQHSDPDPPFEGSASGDPFTTVEDEQEPARSQRRPLLYAGVAVLLLILIFALFRSVVPDQPSTVEVFEELDIVGIEWTQARQEIRSAGVGDSDYEVLQPDGVPAGVDLIVETVEITDDDEVIVHLDPDTAQLIESLDLIGQPWPEAEQQLENVGLTSGSDYQVETDQGQMWRDANWSVAEVRTDATTPQIVVTNEIRGTIEDGTRGVTDWTQEQWQQLQDWDPQDTWDGVRDRLGEFTDRFQDGSAD